MAIDTKQRKNSLLGLHMPWTTTLPDPDGSPAFDREDKQQFLHEYSGLSWEHGEVPEEEKGRRRGFWLWT